MTTPIERRSIFIPIEFRAKGSSETEKANQISGYAARYFDPKNPDTMYQLWEDTFERIMPGAFKSAIDRKDDVRCLFNHDPNNIVGRTAAGTCKLSVDKQGLFFVTELPDSPIGESVAEAIRRGDVTGCSFSFDVLKCTWSEEEEPDEPGETVWYRDITDVRLYDVGPVTFPAYSATDVELKSVRSQYDQAKASRPIPSSVRSLRRRFRLS